MGADAQEDPAHRAGGRRAALADRATARLASQGGWGKEPPPPTILGSPCAVQGQRRLPSSHPQAAAPVTNWRAYDVSLRQRGSLTVWFTEEAIAAWRAEPRTTRGGQPWYSPLAILTALTLRTVFRLALRQTEGLIGSILHLLGLKLAVPDHTTLSRRAATLRVPRPRAGTGPAAAAGRQHRPQAGRPRRVAGREARHEDPSLRRKLHLGVDAGTGEITAAELTTNDVDDGSQVGPLLDQVEGAVASFTGDGAFEVQLRKDPARARETWSAISVARAVLLLEA